MDVEEAGIPEEGSPEAETAEKESQSSGVNYHDRIRAEPDFAVGEVQKKDRYITELHEKQSRFKPLEPYLQHVSGEDLAKLASIGNQVENNPRLKQLMQDAMNGVTPQARESEPEEDEIYDPEIKRLRERYDPRLDEQQQIIRELQTRLNETEAVTMRSSLEGNMEQALTMFADDEEMMEKAQSEILSAVNQLESAAKNGDKSAQSQLKMLGTPQGARTLRMMRSDISDAYYAKKLELSGNRPNGEMMRDKATDARTNTRAAPPADSIAIKSGVRMNSQLVKEVMEKAARKLGKDPDRLFQH